MFANCNQRPNLQLRKLLHPEGKKIFFVINTEDICKVQVLSYTGPKTKLHTRMNLWIITDQPVYTGLFRHDL